MQDSQNGLKLADSTPAQGAASSFFGGATVSETEAKPPADEPASPAAAEKSDRPSLAVAAKEAKAAGRLAVKAAPSSSAGAMPPALSTEEPPSAAKPAVKSPLSSPSQKAAAAPPPIPAQAVFSPPAPTRPASGGGHGKLWLSLLVGLVLLIGAGVWLVRYGMSTLMQRFVNEVESEWVSIPMEMPTITVAQTPSRTPSKPWPYVEVNGVHGSGETGRAILSGELVSVGARSREGVEVVEVESGRVLLRFSGEERYILVGDRTY